MSQFSCSSALVESAGFKRRAGPFEKALKEVEEWCEKYKIPDDHGAAHAIIVVENAKKALGDFQLTDKQQLAVILAALFHDIEDRKFVSSNNLSGTREILQRLELEQEIADLVIQMIFLVSCSKNGIEIDESIPKWYYIPRDADRIEALGHIGIQRAYETTVEFIKRGKVQSCFFSPNTVRCRDEKEVEQVATKERLKEYMKTGYSASLIDHFYDKLLHIRHLSSGSETLQKIAEERHRVMVDFVIDFGKNGSIDWNKYKGQSPAP
jgi:uncharacterized protein